MSDSEWTPKLKGQRPFFAEFVDALASDVANGRLAPGTRLPPHRELARRLQASLATVTRAYREAERRGLVEGRSGSGMFVRDLTSRDSYTPELGQSRFDLGPTAVPSVAGDAAHLALAAALSELAARADLGALTGYQAHGGSRRHREAAVAWLDSLGVKSDAERLSVVSGAQHGTALLLAALARPHGVLVEEVTYPGVLEAAQWLGVPVYPVKMDEEGLLPDALVRAHHASGAKVLYCMPTLQNPTSTVMPLGRRHAVVEACRTYGIDIIENAALAPLLPKSPAPLATLAPERTWLVTSVSKATVPALRIGYVHRPENRGDELESGAAATTWSPSPLLAEVATRWILDGVIGSLRDARIVEAKARQRVAAEVLADHPLRTHPHSYFAWLPLPPHVHATGLVERALERELLIGPAHLFAATPGEAPNAIRISLGAPRSRDELRRGLDVLSDLLGAPARGGRRLL